LVMRNFGYARFYVCEMDVRNFGYARFWVCEILDMRNGCAENECGRFWGVRDIWYVDMFLL
jgi:hypothetical protein